MGWSESELVCKKHQNQNKKQLEGVCPCCLRERLSQLSAATSQRKAAAVIAPSCSSSVPSSPPYSSASSFNAMSPVHRRHHRNVSEFMGSISFMLSVGNELKKSRSIAFVPRNFVGEIKNGKKKRGFWSKLLHRERKKENFMHSRTVSMRERLG